MTKTNVAMSSSTRIGNRCISFHIQSKKSWESMCFGARGVYRDGHSERDQFVAEFSEEGFSPSGRHAEVVFTSLLRKRKKNTKEQQTLSHKKQEVFVLGSRALQKIKKNEGGEMSKCLNKM